MFINTRYLIRKAFQWCWLAVIVGLIAAEVYLFAYKAESKVEETSQMSFEQYEGQYLNNKEADRNAMYRIIWKENPLERLPEGGQKIADYTESVGRFIQQRLKSGIYSHQFYIEMKKQHPEIEADQKDFNIYVVEDEMLTVGVDQQSVLWITIKSPASLSKDKYTGDQLCAYRDLLYQLVTAEVESGSLTNDLGIILERVAPETELDVSEQEYILKLVEPREKTFSKRKALLLFLVGAAIVEFIIIMVALFDNRIKDTKDLEANTDIKVLQFTDVKKDMLETAIKLRSSGFDNKQLTVIGIGIKQSEVAELQEQLKIAFERVGGGLKIKGLLYDTDDLSWLLALDNNQVLIAVKQLQTTYDQLQAFAAQLQLSHNQICGAVLLKAKASSQKG